MRRHPLHLMFAVLPVLISAAAVAQQGYSPLGTAHIPGVPALLQRVDQTRGDVGPLSDSLRDVNMQTELRTPFGFQNVYRVPGRNDLLMRASGGIYAVFPQSVYVATDQGLTAQVPPGTFFTIGPPSNWMLPLRSLGPSLVLERADRVGGTSARSVAAQQGQAGNALALDNRVALRQGILVNDELNTALTGTAEGGFLVNDDNRPIELHQAVLATPPDPSGMLRTIVTDEAYRSQRLAELLHMAAKALRSGQD